MLFAKALKKTVNVAVKRAPGSPLLSVVLPTACQHETHAHTKTSVPPKKKKGKKEGGEVVLSEKRKQQKENTVTMEKDMCSPRRKERTGVSMSYRVKPLTCKTCNTTRRSVQALQS